MSRGVFVACGLFAAACGGPAGDTVSRFLGGACPSPERGTVVLWNDVRSVEAGQTIWLMPYASDSPGSLSPLPSSCIREASLSMPEAGSIYQDDQGDTGILISDEAPLGETITVRASYRDRSLSATFSVYDRDRMPLVGHWRQVEDGCDPDSVIRELVFAADGSFSVTWTPFETYRDYWGRYSFEPETGQLDLEPESQNTGILGIRSGTITLGENRLTPVTASFGHYPDRPACENPFEG